MIGRRKFVATALAESAALLLAPRTAKAADAHVEVLIGEPIGKISPDTGGHFGASVTRLQITLA